MPFDLSTLLPQDVAPLIALALIGFSFVTSALTAMFGLGGGILMLVGLGMVFPPAVLLPIHGMVQLGSNAGRAVVQRRYIHWPTTLWFVAGAVPGTLIGAQIALALPEQFFVFLIVAFVLYSTWGPQPSAMRKEKSPLANFIGGAIISGIGMLVGAVGPLVASFIKWLPDRRNIVATQAAVMTIANMLKVAMFSALGFAFIEYLPLVLLMVLAGVFGTILGSRLLDRLPEWGFRIGFRIALTLAALELLRGAIW